MKQIGGEKVAITAGMVTVTTSAVSGAHVEQFEPDVRKVRVAVWLLHKIAVTMSSRLV